MVPFRRFFLGFMGEELIFRCQIWTFYKISFLLFSWSHLFFGVIRGRNIFRQLLAFHAFYAAYINNVFRDDKKSDEEMVFNEHETELLANYFLTNRTMYNLGLLLCIVTGIRDGELSSLLRGECTSEYLDIHQTETSYKDANTGNNIPLLCKKA